MYSLIRLEPGMDAHSASIASIEQTAFPNIDHTRVVRSEFRRRMEFTICETFALTMAVAVTLADASQPCAIAFVAEGWRRGDLLGLAISQENAGPSAGTLSRDLAALLDPPLTEAARAWRARARIAFDLELRAS